MQTSHIKSWKVIEESREWERKRKKEFGREEKDELRVWIKGEKWKKIENTGDQRRMTTSTCSSELALSQDTEAEEKKKELQ